MRAEGATQARIVRYSLKDLKATRSAREGRTVDLKTTPAEWATALVEKMRQAHRKSTRKGRKRHRNRRVSDGSKGSA